VKKDQRAPYLALCKVPLPAYGRVSWAGYAATMCSFCKHGCYQKMGCEEGGYYECWHSLNERAEGFGDMAESVACDGGDCWGFQPKVSLEVAYGMLHNFLDHRDVVMADDLLLHPKKPVEAQP